MKKFSKVLAAILTGCLLCTTVLPFIVTATDGGNVSGNAYEFATEGATNKLNVTGNELNYSYETPTYTQAMFFKNDDDYSTSLSHEFVNGYYRIYGSEGPQGWIDKNNNAYSATGYAIYTGTNGKSLTDCNYYVYDFDYGTDKYTVTYTADVVRTLTTNTTRNNYEEPFSNKELKGETLYILLDGKEDLEAFKKFIADDTVKSYKNFERNADGDIVRTSTTARGVNLTSQWQGTYTDVITNVEINENSMTLAYYAPALTYFAKGTGSKTAKSLFNIDYDKDTSSYYAYLANANQRVYLSNEIGGTDHITVVLDKGVTVAGKMNATVYINGSYLGRISELAKVADNPRFAGAGIYIKKSQANRATYSIFMDNFAFNAYNSTQEGEIASLVADTGKNVYDCKNVVYSSKYLSPNGAVYLDVDPNDTNKALYCSVPGLIPYLLSGAKDGSKITAEIDVHGFKVPDGVENLSIVYDKKLTTFTFSEDFDEKYLCLDTGDGKNYTVRTLIDSDRLNFKYSLNGAVVKTIRVPFTKAISGSVEFLKLNLKNSTLYKGVCNSWTIDVDGYYEDAPELDLYDEEELRVLTYNEVQLIHEEFGGELVVNGNFNNAALTTLSLSGFAYVAGRVVDGELYVLEDSLGGYTQYTKISTLESESANWDDDVKCYKIQNGTAKEYTWTRSASAPDSSKALWHTDNTSAAETTIQFNTEYKFPGGIGDNFGDDNSALIMQSSLEGLYGTVTDYGKLADR